MERYNDHFEEDGDDGDRLLENRLRNNQWDGSKASCTKKGGLLASMALICFIAYLFMEWKANKDISADRQMGGFSIPYKYL